MTDLQFVRIFCRQRLLEPSIEHVDPDSLGGTLKITFVCKAA